MKPSVAIIFVAVLASLLEIIDSAIVNVAVPTMMGNLGATLEDISMVITGYTVANAIVLPLSGWMSERVGRRPYYLTCIALFTITSVACGLAPNLTTLIIFRILQGLAGGALLPTSQALIFEQFPKEKAGIAGAIFGMSVMIGPTLGPVLGGYLTDQFGWRSIFNVNLPLGLLALAVGYQVIFNRKGAPTQKETSFDGVGLALLCLGVGCLQFLLERGEAEDWFHSRLIWVNAMLAFSCLPGFVWWELKVKNPVIDIRLMMAPIVRNGIMLMASLGFFLYGVVFLLPVFVSRVLHYDATQTGALFIPGSILTAAMMPIIGKRMQAGTDPKKLILIGFLSIELCLYSMTQFSPLSDRGEIIRMLFIRGFGMAFLFVPINSTILSQFGGAQLGQVSGMLNLFRQIGGSIGIALVGTLLTTRSLQNFSDLLIHVTPFDFPAVQQLSQSAQSLGSKLSLGMGSSTAAALQLLRSRIENQAFIMSFIQVIWVMIFAVGFALFPLWRIKLKDVKPAANVDFH